MSDDNIINLDNITRLDLPVERIINGAAEADLAGAIVVGWDKQGEFYFASSYADGGSVIWLLEKAKIELLRIGED